MFTVDDIGIAQSLMDGVLAAARNLGARKLWRRLGGQPARYPLL
jgi:hypothetical protein